VFIETVIAFPRGYVTFELGERRRTMGKIVLATETVVA